MVNPWKWGGNYSKVREIWEVKLLYISPEGPCIGGLQKTYLEAPRTNIKKVIGDLLKNTENVRFEKQFFLINFI